MKNDRLIVGALIAIIVLNVALYFDVLERVFQWRWQFMDFRGQWAICAYTLRGIDPYPLTGLETALIEDIGTIPKDWGTSPYGCLLGNVFYAGFLTFEQAKIFFVAACILMILAAAICLWRRFRRQSKTFATVATAFALLLYTAFSPIYSGNAGGMICCLLLMTCLLSETAPILSGIFFSLAMIKPQTALPIGFALLILRRFRPVLIAALIDVIGWFGAALLTQRGMLELLREFLGANIGGGAQFSGLFTLLFIGDPKSAMLSSMVFGFAFIAILMSRLNENVDDWLKFYPACLATAFFGYSHGNEYYMLLLPFLAIARIIMTVDGRREKLLWLLALTVLLTAPNAFSYLIIAAFNRGIDVLLVMWGLHTLFAVTLIVTGVIMIGVLNRNLPLTNRLLM